MAGLRSLGKLVEEQRLQQELHLALGRALRRHPVLVEHSVAGGAGHPHPNPIEFLFYHQLIFVSLIFFPFPSGYRPSSKEEGLELTRAMSTIYGY